MPHVRVGPPNHMRIIANDVERSRLMVDNILVYAKGLVNLDPNLPKDGEGYEIQLSESGRARLNLYTYAYYNNDDENGGTFYKYSFYGNEKHYVSGETSTPWITTRNDWARFDGWWTTKDNRGYKIETVKDLKEHTNLFEYKSSKSIPLITLYAHWTVKTFTVTVKVIKESGYGDREFSSTSSYYDKEWRRRSYSDKTFKNVKIGTEIIRMINDKITEPIYCSWVMNYRAGGNSFLRYLKLSDTEKTAFNKGKYQPFYGWSRKKDGEGKICNSWILNEEDDTEINIWPQFKLLIVWLNTQDLSPLTNMTNHLLLTCPATYTYNDLLKDVRSLSGSIPHPHLYSRWYSNGTRYHAILEWVYNEDDLYHVFSYWTRSGANKTKIIGYRTKDTYYER